MKPCRLNRASPSRSGRSADSVRPRSPAACSPPRPTSRNASSRARDRLRDLDVDFEAPAAPQLCTRLDAVLAVVYLLFSQGCHVTHGDMPIRRDLCDQARRLRADARRSSHRRRPGGTCLARARCASMGPASTQASRSTAIVLLEEQDRCALELGDAVREGMAWLRQVSRRRRADAFITWKPASRGSTAARPTFADTDWRRIAELYTDTLDRIAPSPLHSLNRAVAEAYVHGPQAGLDRLAAVLPENAPARYPGWHAVIGELHFRLGRHSAAGASAWPGKPLRFTTARADREFLRRRLAVCRPDGGEPATE